MNATKKSADDYATVHARRFELSLQWLKGTGLLFGPETAVLELGGESPFTPLLRDRYPGVNLHTPYGYDLREVLPMELRDMSCRYDLVLAMELLEHISDPEHDGIHTEWTGIGARNLLKSCWSALKPGGWLFLTTPNPCSITALRYCLSLAPPMIYRPHFREYAPYELDELLRQTGFTIVSRETFDVWRNAITPQEHKSISEMLAKHGFPTHLRGEDIFVLARRR